MRRVMFTQIVILVVLLLPGVPLFGGVNLVDNPGFEDGVLAPWTGRGGDADIVPGAVTEPTPYSGSYCGRAYNRSASWHGIEQNLIAKYQAGTIVSDQEYYVSGFLRTNVATDISCSLSLFYKENGTDHYFHVVDGDLMVNSSAWVKFEGTITLPEGITDLILYAEYSDDADGANEIFLDNAYLGIGPDSLADDPYRGTGSNPGPSGEEVNWLTTDALTWDAPPVRGEHDPNDPNLLSINGYTVWFGIEPNVWEYPANEYHPEPLTETSLLLDGEDGNPGPLDPNTTYFWRVDVDGEWDSNSFTGTAFTTGIREGQVWSFTTLLADLPPVIAAPDKVISAPEFGNIIVNATVDDVGWYSGDVKNSSWSQFSGGDNLSGWYQSNPVGNYSPVLTVIPNGEGTHVFRLTVTDDGDNIVTHDVEIQVAADACAAAQLTADFKFESGDYNGDCVVNIDDLKGLAAEWLDNQELLGQENQ